MSFGNIQNEITYDEFSVFNSENLNDDNNIETDNVPNLLIPYDDILYQVNYKDAFGIGIDCYNLYNNEFDINAKEYISYPVYEENVFQEPFKIECEENKFKEINVKTCDNVTNIVIEKLEKENAEYKETNTSLKKEVKETKEMLDRKYNYIGTLHKEIRLKNGDILSLRRKVSDLRKDLEDETRYNKELQKECDYKESIIRSLKRSSKIQKPQDSIKVKELSDENQQLKEEILFFKERIAACEEGNDTVKRKNNSDTSEYVYDYELNDRKKRKL